MIKQLLKQLQQSVENRKPDLILGDPDDPVMERWHLKNDSRGFIFLHKISKDDYTPHLHNHSCDNSSQILEGTLREVFYKDQLYNNIEPTFNSPFGEKILKTGDIYSRPAKLYHKLEVVDGPVWTLFITGPAFDDWGFLTENGFVRWSEYTQGMRETR